MISKKTSLETVRVVEDLNLRKNLVGARLITEIKYPTWHVVSSCQLPRRPPFSRCSTPGTPLASTSWTQLLLPISGWSKLPNQIRPSALMRPERRLRIPTEGLLSRDITRKSPGRYICVTLAKKSSLPCLHYFSYCYGFKAVAQLSQLECILLAAGPFA
jgi:hypothetical protein